MGIMFGHLSVGDIFWIGDHKFKKIEKVYDGCCSPLYTAFCFTVDKNVFINHNRLVEIKDESNEN